MKEVYECYNFLKAGDYKKAIEAGKRAIKKYPNNPVAHYCLGISYHKIGELKLALEHMKRAESLTSDKKKLMYIYNEIGLIYLKIGYLDDALLYLSRSLSLARDLENRSMQASVLNNIAGIYGYKGELDKALGYIEESLRLKTDEKEKAPTYNNMAGIYYKKGDYQKAVEYFQKAIEIAERYGDYHRASRWKLNLGNTYRKMKDYEKAEKYILEGLEGVKKVGDKYWGLGDIYALVGYTETRETKRRQKITLLVPIICLLNPSVQKGMPRESFLIYKSFKRKSSYIEQESQIGFFTFLPLKNLT
jgi:tetratricopeptide (TPR) repeat protein